MTSHFIDQHAKRAKQAPAEAMTGAGLGQAERACPFCAIISGQAKAYKVYEDEDCMAFLDTLPIREGHTLLIPKMHAARLSHLTDQQGSAVGRALPRLSRAICRAMDQPDFNVVSNNGYAQVVHHLHFHIVPAPNFNKPQGTARQRYSQFDNRYELDDDEGERLAASIREAVSALEADEREPAEIAMNANAANRQSSSQTQQQARM